MDVEASRAIRQAEVGAAKTMIERTEERFDIKPKRLAPIRPTGRGQTSARACHHDVVDYIANRVARSAHAARTACIDARPDRRFARSTHLTNSIPASSVAATLVAIPQSNGESGAVKNAACKNGT
jgi:hypothetical protein